MLLQLREPDNEEEIQALRPVFLIRLSAGANGDEVLVEVQFDDDVNYPSPTSLTEDVLLQGDIADVLLYTTSDLTIGTQYFMRGRFTLNEVTSAWFYHNNLAADSWFQVVAVDTFDESVDWEVDSGAERVPHLWAVVPDRGSPGDTVTVYGHGFSTAEGTVTINGVSATIQDWDHVAATGNAGDPTRVINPGVLIDAQHDEAVITVPSVAAPGGPVVVDD
jgi:hypothetical protein